MKETEKSRAAKIQRLINEREQQFPNEQYEDRFNAVIASPEGQEIFAQMHLSNEELVPVQSPRHAALLGRQWPIPDGEFRKLWIEKFGPSGSLSVSGGQKSPVYPSEEQTRRQTGKAAGGSFQGDAKLKDEGRRGFLDEVARQMALGHTRDQAWAISGSTSPGREFYAQWSSGSAQVKRGA